MSTLVFRGKSERPAGYAATQQTDAARMGVSRNYSTQTPQHSPHFLGPEEYAQLHSQSDETFNKLLGANASECVCRNPGADETASVCVFCGKARLNDFITSIQLLDSSVQSRGGAKLGEGSHEAGDGDACVALTELLLTAAERLGPTIFGDALYGKTSKHVLVPSVMRRLVLYRGDRLEARVHVFINSAETYVHNHGNAFYSIGLVGEYQNTIWGISHNGATPQSPSLDDAPKASGAAGSFGEESPSTAATTGAGDTPAGDLPSAGDLGVTTEAVAGPDQCHFRFCRDQGNKLTSLGAFSGSLEPLSITKHGQGRCRLLPTSEFHSVKPLSKLAITLTVRDVGERSTPVQVLSSSSSISSPVAPVTKLDSEGDERVSLRELYFALHFNRIMLEKHKAETGACPLSEPSEPAPIPVESSITGSAPPIASGAAEGGGGADEAT